MPEFGPVKMTTRPHAVMARVIRMTNTSVAATAGLSVDKVEDVALATNEAFGVALSRPGSPSVTCTIEADVGTVRVRMTPESSRTPTLPAPEVDPLADRVLRSITADFNHDRATGEIDFTITNA